MTDPTPAARLARIKRFCEKMHKLSMSSGHKRGMVEESRYVHGLQRPAHLIELPDAIAFTAALPTYWRILNQALAEVQEITTGNIANAREIQEMSFRVDNIYMDFLAPLESLIPEDFQ